MPPRNDSSVAMPGPNAPAPKKGTLAAVVGVFAATVLLTLTPEEESGRKVAVTVQQDGTATVRHVSGKQYLRAYLDIVGVATICDGLTKGVRMGQQLTEAQCATLLEAELTQKAIEVKRCTPSLWRPGTDQQRIAVVLHAYNIGTGGWCNQSSARRLFEAGQFRAGCAAFAPWNKGSFPASQVPRLRARGETCTRNARGVWKCTIKGLTDRRARETKICMVGL